MTEEVNAAPLDAGQAAPAPVDGQGAANSGTFLESFADDDMRGYIEKKGFKDAGALADSYRNLEKLRGVPSEQLLQLPADMGDGEAMGAVYERLGRPESAESYTNTLGDEFNTDVFKGIAAKAHELGLSDKQFQGLQEITSQQSQAVLEAQETQAAEAFDKWKGDNADGFTKAAKLMADVGMNEESLEGLLAGDKASMYDFLAKVAGRTGEAAVIEGQPSQGEGFNMSPSVAKQKVSELFADADFMKQYTSQSKKVRQPAIDRMMKLQEIASRA